MESDVTSGFRTDVHPVAGINIAKSEVLGTISTRPFKTAPPSSLCPCLAGSSLGQVDLTSGAFFTIEPKELMQALLRDQSSCSQIR